MSATSEQLGISNNKEGGPLVLLGLDGYIDIDGIKSQVASIVDNLSLKATNHFEKQGLLHSLLTKGFNLDEDEKLFLIQAINKNIVSLEEIYETFSLGLSKRSYNEEELDFDEKLLSESIEEFIEEFGIHNAKQLIDITSIDFINKKIVSIYNNLVNSNSEIEVINILGNGHTSFKLEDGYFVSKSILNRNEQYTKVK